MNIEVSAIKYLFSYELFGQTLYITSTHVTLFIIVAVLTVLALIVHHKFTKHADEVPGTFQNIIEMLVEAIDGLISGALGEKARGYRNYIGTVGVFILVSNLSGVIGLRAPTADYGVTLFLGILSFLVIQISAFRAQKIGYLKSLCEPMPLLLPSNIIGEISTPISLSLRLFANMLSGAMILSIWYGLLGWFSLLPLSPFLHAYLDVFSGAIQTYVFIMLTMTNINDKIS